MATMYFLTYRVKKKLIVISLSLSTLCLGAQNTAEKIRTAFTQFESDTQLKHASVSLYIINAANGKVVFDKNSMMGLAPASTQKIITSVSGYELLGRNFRYRTVFELLYDDVLHVIPSGDPSFGSWRWKSTQMPAIVSRLTSAMSKISDHSFRKITVDMSGWDTEAVPDGWIWQDIGNYYGAGAQKLNWRENQADLILRSGSRVGDPVSIIGVDPPYYSDMYLTLMQSKATSAKTGSGDNAYFYYSFGNEEPNRIRGTIPVNERSFPISIAAKDPHRHFVQFLIDTLNDLNKFRPAGNFEFLERVTPLQHQQPRILFTHESPTMDTLIYWFNRKSINLYGEALVKTIAFNKVKQADTDSGVNIIRDFWKTKGISPGELNIRDGSGLSPLNRVTTHAQVEILRYARSKDWFSSFYHALPEYNDMKMKSGTISDVKGFCGYHKSRDGTEYIFSFLVNNYDGSATSLVNKMYKVLDQLK